MSKTCQKMYLYAQSVIIPNLFIRQPNNSLRPQRDSSKWTTAKNFLLILCLYLLSFQIFHKSKICIFPSEKCPTDFITAIGTNPTKVRAMTTRHIRTRMIPMLTVSSSMDSMTNHIARPNNKPIRDKCSRQEMVLIQV